MQEAVHRLWPELEWIEDKDLRAKTARVWEYALEQSVLEPEDLETMPFTLLAKKAVSFMAHKRSVVHICRESARLMREFYGDALPIDMDVLMAGAPTGRKLFRRRRITNVPCRRGSSTASSMSHTAPEGTALAGGQTTARPGREQEVA